MARKAFEMMTAGMEDAIAYAQGDTSRGRAIRVVIDVAAVRARTRKTQADFAAAYHIPVGTVRDWEQKRRQPDAPARVLLSMISADPEAVELLVARATA